MTRAVLGLSTAFLVLAASPLAAQQQPATPPVAQPAPPPFATTKVEGTDNIYVFRYQGHQAMFIVTPEGVIATDPISDNRPAAETYVAEIRKITQAPIRYVIYSHHHPDHIAGGKPFKDAGATFVAHRIAKDRLTQMARADIVIPDETVDEKRSITLGGTEIELLHVGKNHSDNSLVMRLPKEKVLFAVDFIPVQSMNWRNMPNSYLPDWHDSLKRVLALDWDRMIPGHPYVGRLGTKQDLQNHLTYMDDLSAEVKKVADAGQCTEAGLKELKMPKYATWLDYDQFLASNAERYCTFWRDKK